MTSNEDLPSKETESLSMVFKNHDRPNIFVLRGGFGNQMFILCAALALQSLRNTDFQLNANLLSKNMYEGLTRREFALDDLIKPSEYQEPVKTTTFGKLIEVVKWNLQDDPRKYNSQVQHSNRSYFRSYFQDFRIVETAWPELQSRISNSRTFSRLLSSKVNDHIAIHVRLSDYQTNTRARKLHGVTESSYYIKNAENLRLVHGCNNIVLISDNKPLVRKLLFDKLVIRGFKVFQSEATHMIDDLQQISESKYVIASNSSFSWWGSWFAWQNGADEIVIPSPWLSKISKSESNLQFPQWRVANRQIDHLDFSDS